MRVQVEIQADNLKTTPRSLYWDERRIGIVELIDHWYGPDYRYVKLKGDDGGVYILRFDEIRNEYNHNVSQQVYMTEEVWNQVRNAKEDLIMMINESATQVASDSTSIELSKKIFEMVMNKKQDPIGHALSELKKEIQQVF